MVIAGISDFRFPGFGKMLRQYVVQKTAAAVKIRELAICSCRNRLRILIFVIPFKVISDNIIAL